MIAKILSPPTPMRAMGWRYANGPGRWEYASNAELKDESEWASVVALVVTISEEGEDADPVVVEYVTANAMRYPDYELIVESWLGDGWVPTGTKDHTVARIEAVEREQA